MSEHQLADIYAYLRSEDPLQRCPYARMFTHLCSRASRAGLCHTTSESAFYMLCVARSIRWMADGRGWKTGGAS